MSRTKTKQKPLTLKQLADMDYKHETKKAGAIKDRGVEQVTAPVTAANDNTGPSQAELAAVSIIAQSKFFDVTPHGNFKAVVDDASRFGKMLGKLSGYHEGIRAPRNAGEQRALDQAPAIGKILSEVYRETRRAVSKHGPMHSGHEGVAVIREELDELWDEVKADRGKMASARAEAVQVAAMAVRYVLDLDPR